MISLVSAQIGLNEVVALDTESGLRQLMARGYQFIHPRDAQGVVVAVVGIRVHDDVIDVVRISDEDDVVARRLPGETKDVLSPETVLWQTEGEAPDVLAELLALPDDRTPGALDATTDGPAKGCWVTDQAGTAKWLAAS